jgi:hypothetical protein
LFYRLNTDGTRQDVDLRDMFAGPTRTACWIVGGGPSLAELPCAAIGRSPVAKLAINLGGTRLVRPNLWTSYDPSARFHRSVYLDASIWKFVHARRAMDLVPETTFKVCECPGVLFFERDAQRGFADFLPPRPTGIVDWNDSFVQAIEIAYRIGFRVLYLAGCDFCVRPSTAQIERARGSGVEYIPRELLDGFFERCVAAGIARTEMETLEPPPQYHFDERKPLAAAIQTDLHYFRTAQYLRLSRRALSLAGLELVSVTSESRLNEYFPYRAADDVLADLGATVGRPDEEPTQGLYTRVGTRTPAGIAPMRDLKPHHWKRKREAPAECAAERTPEANRRPDSDAGVGASVRRRVTAALAAVPETRVCINEEG